MEAKGFVQRMKAMTTNVLKQADTFMPAWGSWIISPSRTSYNYKADIGEGLGSSVVMPVVQWLQRSFPEAPLVVRRQQQDELEIVNAHPLVELVNRPNDAYPGTLLWMVTMSDWCLFGESFWRILYTQGGQPGELWWIPPWAIEPQWPRDGSAFISHYTYRPEIGTSIDLTLDEVLHFRHSLDPQNPRHGMPPLRAMLREIWSDQESSNWVASILRNMGIPGLILSPKGEAQLSTEEVDRVKAYISSRFTGDGRGQPLALGAPTDVQHLSFSPNDMDLTVWRNTAEERVSAALGVPSAVVGFHSGLENSKVGATMNEFVRLAWNNGLIPVQRLMAGELQRVLLPQFEPNPEGFLTGWNYDEVQALQEDQNELVERYNKMLLSGGILKSEYRQALGYESSPEDEIYLHPNTHTATDPKDQMPKPEPIPTALPLNGNGNGNGNGVAPNGDTRTRQPAQEQRALLSSTTKQGGTLESLIQTIVGRHAQRLDNPPQALARLTAKLYRQEQSLQPRLQRMIREVLGRYGDVVAVAAKEILIPPVKQDLTDAIRASIMLERVPLLAVRADLAAVYEQLYEQMFNLTMAAMREAIDAEVASPQRIQRQLQAAAQARTVLLDLPTEARNGIIEILANARETGQDEDTVIRLLREKIPAGPSKTVEQRSVVIARTESRFASNITTAEYARDIGARLLVFDARLGATDAMCEERNGWVINASEATSLAATEHPNGTLGFAPLTQSMAQVSGVTS